MSVHPSLGKSHGSGIDLGIPFQVLEWIHVLHLLLISPGCARFAIGDGCVQIFKFIPTWSKPHMKQIPLPERWVLSELLRNLRAPSPWSGSRFCVLGSALWPWHSAGRRGRSISASHGGFLPLKLSLGWSGWGGEEGSRAYRTIWGFIKHGFVKNGEMLPCNLIFLLWLTEPRWHWGRKWNKYTQEVFSPSYLIHQKGHLTIQQLLIYIKLLFMHPVNIRSNF